jgi:hypothetical protein
MSVCPLAAAVTTEPTAGATGFERRVAGTTRQTISGSLALFRTWRCWRVDVRTPLRTPSGTLLCMFGIVPLDILGSTFIAA